MKKSYSSDIMINWNDMRTQFGYKLLGAISGAEERSKWVS